MHVRGDTVRLLVIPGLGDSGPAHWQTWLQAHHRRAVRVQQDDWTTPDLIGWSQRIADTLASEPNGAWVAVAHSFGCLALAQHLAQLGRERRDADAPRGIVAALFVAPADPAHFGAGSALSERALPVPSVLIASDTDPWMSAGEARRWARRWGSRHINLGDVGHINVASGFGPLPIAKDLVQRMIGRAEGARRLSRAHVRELSFSV